MGEINGEQFLRVWELDEAAARAISKPLSEFRFGQSVPESFVFSHDGRYLYGSSYYTGVSNIFRYEVATGDDRGGVERRVGLLPPGAARRRPAGRADLYRRRASCRRSSSRARSRTSARSRSSGAEIAAKHPVVTTWQVPPPSTVDEEKLIIGQGRVRPAAQPAARECLPGAPGLQGLGRDRLPRSTSRTRSGSRTSASRRPTRRTAICPTTSAATCRDQRALPRLARRRSPGTARTSTTSSDRPSAAARATRPSSATTDSLIYDDPRQLTSKFDVALLRQDRHAADRAERRRRRSAGLLTGEVGLYYTDVRRSIGAVDDEKGLRLVAVATRQPRERRDARRSSAARFDYGFALPLPNSSLWLRSAAGVASGDRDNPRRQLLLRRLRQQLRRQRRGQALPRVLRVPRLRARRDQRTQRSCGRWSSGTCRRSCSSRSARRRSTSRGCARRCSPRRCGPTRSARDRKDYANVGAQVDLRFSVLHWYDMTLSVGLCGRLHERAARRHRVDDLAQDPVATPSCRSIVLLDALVGLRRCWASSPRSLYLDSYKLVTLRAGRRGRCLRRGGGRRQLPRERAMRSASRRIDFTNYSRYVAPIVEELAEGRRHRCADPRPSHRIPGGRGDLRLRGRHRLRDRREPPLPAPGPGCRHRNLDRARLRHRDHARRRYRDLRRAEPHDAGGRPAVDAPGVPARLRASPSCCTRHTTTCSCHRSSRRLPSSSCCRRCSIAVFQRERAGGGRLARRGFDADTDMLESINSGTILRFADRPVPAAR